MLSDGALLCIAQQQAVGQRGVAARAVLHALDAAGFDAHAVRAQQIGEDLGHRLTVERECQLRQGRVLGQRRVHGAPSVHSPAGVRSVAPACERARISLPSAAQRQCSQRPLNCQLPICQRWPP